MPSPLQSLIASGTRLWLDSIDPQLVEENRRLGATGATSNPIIVADLIRSERFDERVSSLIEEGRNDESIAWQMTDHLVREAQKVFHPVWKQSRGDDGYVSFELDPLLEDEKLGPAHDRRVASYIELGRRWSAGHENRMIKVPATAAGLEALETLAAEGLTLNVTLIFTERQYEIARDAIWRGAQRRPALDGFKSVYSIFVSRVDVYTENQVPQLGPDAQGLVGIVNAKRIWASNRQFWLHKDLPLSQQIIFASTGTKRPEDAPDKYVDALAGSDIQTNPPKTNELIEQLGRTYACKIDRLPPDPVLARIDDVVDMQMLEETLLAEGVRKFADPHKALIQLIADKRGTIAAAP